MVGDINLEKARRVAAGVPDPELPFLTVEDLGILRDVSVEDNVIVARLTPTYSGCPAVAVIEKDVLDALTQAGFKARVVRSDTPAWTTSWITPEGIQKLQSNGISPPEPAAMSDGLFAKRAVTCPRCRSEDTEKVSEFGSTPCKAQYRCTSCSEPFDHFKCH